MKKQTEGFLRDSVKANLAKTRVVANNNAELERIRVAQAELYVEIDALKKQLNEQVCALLDSRDLQLGFNSHQAQLNLEFMKSKNRLKWVIISQVVVLVTAIILAVWA